MWMRKKSSRNPDSGQFKTARCILHRQGRYLLAVHASFWGTREPRWGLPGGQIERGETPLTAVRRELNEELSLTNLRLEALGAYPYKRADHMVYAAPVHTDVAIANTAELLDLGWFSAAEVADLQRARKLHADYEHQAIQLLRARLNES